MDFKNDKTLENSPQILPFPPKKQPSKLPINIEDEKARQYYQENYPMVKGVCMRILHNKEDAEDMAQEVFAYVYKNLNKEEQSSLKKSYLFKAAKNMSLNRKKREKARLRKELDAIYIMTAYASLKWLIDRVDEEGIEKWEAGLVDNGYEQVEAEIIVKAILDEQDETNRKIYFYKYHFDMTLEQIGNAVGLGTVTVHDRLKAMKEQVRLKIGRVE
jgi:RNA polymerase sigma-70 factor (ECF subfamily)